MQLRDVNTIPGFIVKIVCNVLTKMWFIIITNNLKFLNLKKKKKKEKMTTKS